MNHKYEIIEKIGEGAYGIVFKCKNTQTNEIVAIKKFLDEYEKLPKKEVKREIFTLQVSKHENIVKFIEAFLNKGYLFLVFEYAEENLLQLIEKQTNGLDQELIRSFIYQICKAVSYLHKKNIIHRDIKPENILIKDNSKIKLCDFGFARKMKMNENNNSYEKMTDYMATRWYRAPELILGQGNYGPEIDFWSIGCLIGEMATGNAMFPGDSQINQLEYIIKIIGNLPENLVKFYNDNPIFNVNKLLIVDKPETLEKKYENILSPDAIDFMKGLLELDPKKRLNADTVFNHKYFECYKNIRINERKENNLFLSYSIDDKKKIKIPNLSFNPIKKDSKIINIFKYNDESFISDTNESTVSKKKSRKIEKNNLIKSFQNKKRKQYRSDMVDFGNIFLLSEKAKIEEKSQINENKESEDKKNSNILNDSNDCNNSPVKQLKLKLIDKGLNHKKSFSMIKNNNLYSSSNKNILEDNFPYLSPILLAKNKFTDKRNREKESKKINYCSLLKSLKLGNDINSFGNPIYEESKKEIILTSDKSESKINKNIKINNHSLDYKNKIHNNKNYFKSVKMKSFDNFINRNQDESNSSNRIVNLYENTFKDLVLANKEKEKLYPSPKKKRKSVITGIFKNIPKQSLNSSLKKKKFMLPPIFNFHNDIINNKNEKMCKDFFKYDFKFVNNRYKIN